MYDVPINHHKYFKAMDYELRIKFSSSYASSSTYDITSTSDTMSFSTNSLPENGTCEVENADDVHPLDTYSLSCSGWNDSNASLEYNALISNVPLSTSGYVTDPGNLTSIAPSGYQKIIMLVKEVGVANAITCYEFHANFTSITTLLSNGHTNVSNVCFSELDVVAK